VPEAAVGRALPLWLTVILGVAGTAGAVWGLSAAAPILAPVFLAFVLTVVAHPMIGALVRHGVRRGWAVALAVLVVEGVLVGFGIAIFLSFARLASELPRYADEWRGVLDDVRGALSDLGIGQEQVQDALSSLGPESVLAGIRDVLSGVVGAVAAMVLVVATVLFMTAEGAGLPERLAAAPGSWRLRAALGSFARNTRRYIVVTSIFGLLVAVVDTVALVLLGIPLPLLWGLLSFLTNYVPNIGFFLGLAPPALLGLLVDGPRLMLVVIAVYALANFVIQSVIQPIFVGDAVGLSVTLSFLSVIVWTVVLGPLGAVLAIPLTLFLHAVLVGQDPDRRWAKILLAGTSATATPSRHRWTHAGRGLRRRRPDAAGSSAEDDAADRIPSQAGSTGRPPRPPQATGSSTATRPAGGSS
jgi:predicted PurR-regulated permease PerM